MATTTVILDDIDGSVGATRPRFTFNERSWEIDLSKENQRKLWEALEPFVKRARQVEDVRGGAKKAPKPLDYDQEAVRQWARANGHQVGDRGRIPSEIVNAYREHAMSGS